MARRRGRGGRRGRHRGRGVDRQDRCRGSGPGQRRDREDPRPARRHGRGRPGAGPDRHRRRRQRRRPVAAQGRRGRAGDGRRRGRRGPRRRLGRIRVRAARADRNAGCRGRSRRPSLGRPGRPRRRSGGGRNLGCRDARDGRVGDRGNRARVARLGGSDRRRGRHRDRGLDRQGGRGGPGAGVAGRSRSCWSNVDDTVQVGQALAEMAAGAGNGASAAAPAPAETETETETPPAAPAEVDQGNGKASPVARRIAAAKGIDLGAVSGSGPGGKVVKEDVLAAADGGNGAGPAVGVAAGEVKPLRGPAAMLAKAMDESRSVPTATSFRTLAVDTLDAKRKAINGALKDRGNEGLVHPPDRLGDRPRGNRVAGDGPQLQRGRRQAAGGRGAGGQPRDRGRRRAQGGPQPPGPVHQGRRERRLRRLPLALRGADHHDAREQAHRRRLPGDERSRSPTPAGSGRSPRSRG